MSDNCVCRWRWKLLFGMAIALTLVAVLMPGSGLQWFRQHSDLFSHYMSWNDTQPTMFDLGHVILFALLGYVAARALLTWRKWQVVAALALLGAFSELTQIWIPGRHARVSDFITDVLAGAFACWLSRRLAMQRYAEEADA